jgi:hypothetical protein
LKFLIMKHTTTSCAYFASSITSAISHDLWISLLSYSSSMLDLSCPYLGNILELHQWLRALGLPTLYQCGRNAIFSVVGRSPITRVIN